MLVVQAMLAAFAVGAAAAAPMLDAFGNPLCIAGMAASGTGDSPDSALPGCCTGACGMVAPLAPASPAARSLANPLAFSIDAPRGSMRAAPPAAEDHDPGSPRAPPPA